MTTFFPRNSFRPTSLSPTVRSVKSGGGPRIAERVMVHDHPTPGRVDDPRELVDGALDRVAPDLALEIGHRPGDVEQRRPLLHEVRRRDGGRRTLEVRGEHEALALGWIDDREHDDRPEGR